MENPFDFPEDREENWFLEDLEADVSDLYQNTALSLIYLRSLDSATVEMAWRRDRADRAARILSFEDGHKSLEASDQSLYQRMDAVERYIKELKHGSETDIAVKLGPSTIAYSMRITAKHAFDIEKERE